MTRKIRFLVYPITVFLICLSVIVGCDDDPDPINPPTLTTLAASEITDTSAKSGGNISDDGGGEITARGVVWNTEVNPTLENHSGITVDGTGEGVFQSNITGISAGASYYVRAYATNSAGTSYGNDVMFETHSSEFLLTLKVNPEDAGDVAGAGEYQAGAQVTIEASPDEGWEFVEWTGDTDYVDDPSSANTTVTMPEYDITLTANFQKEDSGEWPRDTETEVVEVTNPATGKTWMDRNLGASRAATSSTDEQAYGDLYQWGRAADGHQKRNSETTSTLSGSDTPGHGSFIGGRGDWRSPRNDDLWQGISGVNNPCPDGYRLPTVAELRAERQSWSSNDADGAFASPLKLPEAGRRLFTSGSLSNVGSNGYYWSSTVAGSDSWLLSVFSTGSTTHSHYRALGFSVRCLKD